MHSQRQPDSLDVIGGGDVASGVPGWAGAGRGEQNGGPAGSAEGQSSGPGVILAARPPGQPFRVGPGFIRAGFHTTGQGLGEHQRGGGLQFAAEQAGRAGRLESQGPPVLATCADLGEFHLAPRLLAQPRGARPDLPAG